VPQHLGLGVMRVEDRMLEIGRSAAERLRDGRLAGGEIGTGASVRAEDLEEVGDVAVGERLVERDPHGSGIGRAEFDPALDSKREARTGTLLRLNPKGIEEVVVYHVVA